MVDDSTARFPGIAWKTIVTHTITCFVMGVLALTLLRYGEQFSRPEMSSWIFVGLVILSTFGPTSGSTEGMVYTLTPFRNQVVGWLMVRKPGGQ